jgi:phosphatidylethanolamine-binding protein (PEBP) family uncharacterized protein
MMKILLILSSVALCLVSCSSQDSLDWLCKTGTVEAPNADFAIWCPTQTKDYFIPAKYGCPPRGEGIAPPISWKGVPKEATHLRILVVDTMCDYECNDECMHVHWQLDLPLKQIEQSSNLSENAIVEGASEDPSIVALTLPNSHGERKYLPICVAELQTHAIVFKAIAYRLEGSKKIPLAKTQSSPLLFSFDKNPSAAQSPAAFLLDLARLKKEERWQEIVTEGEKVAAYFREKGEYQNEFYLIDELVAHYFRLGEFAKACEKSKRMGELATLLKRDSAIVDSLYKLSGAIRGLAGEAKEKTQERLLFAEARRYGELALEHCRKNCPEEYTLLARVLFNAGAANSDDPEGNVEKALSYYKDALEIFNVHPDGDYSRRTEIRLGKAYLLLGQIENARQVVDKLRLGPFEPRTFMHWMYLEAQVAMKEGKNKEAIEVAEKGKALALNLNAKADKKRFEDLLKELR